MHAKYKLMCAYVLKTYRGVIIYALLIACVLHICKYCLCLAFLYNVMLV